MLKKSSIKEITKLKLTRDKQTRVNASLLVIFLLVNCAFRCGLIKSFKLTSAAIHPLVEYHQKQSKYHFPSA